MLDMTIDLKTNVHNACPHGMRFPTATEQFRGGISLTCPPQLCTYLKEIQYLFKNTLIQLSCV